jgi:hypothetical protein
MGVPIFVAGAGLRYQKKRIAVLPRAPPRLMPASVMLRR